MGQLVAALRRLQQFDNTLIIFTSDNGPVVDDGYHDGSVQQLGNHRPSGAYRGGKYSNFEAGTRVPWIVHWPGHVQPGVSHALISQVDLLRSLAVLVDRPLASDAGPDSANVLSALLGTSEQGRELLIEQGSTTSLRDGPWKLIPAHKGPAWNRNVNIELGNFATDQLYNLDDDPGERTNLATEHPYVLQRMKSQLANLKSGT